MQEGAVHYSGFVIIAFVRFILTKAIVGKPNCIEHFLKGEVDMWRNTMIFVLEKFLQYKGYKNWLIFINKIWIGSAVWIKKLNMSVYLLVAPQAIFCPWLL